MKKIELVQGSEEWLEFRKNKITATDAPIIMGASPWKTRLQLFYEKISDMETLPEKNDSMSRGIELEPIARSLFSIKKGIEVKPCVVVKDWAMASLDGLSEDETVLVEIKCPSEKTHQMAMNGEVPYIYYIQMQHQMYVCDLKQAYYFSFDGIDGEILTVERNEEFLEKMIEEEQKFLHFMKSKTFE